MKVFKEGFIQQLNFSPTLFPVSCYFVEEKNELTLVDTALPNSYKSIIDTAQKVGKPLTRIVLTHAHRDHIGSLDKLKEMLPDVMVYISKRDERLLRGDRSLDKNENKTPIKGGVPKPGEVKTQPDVLLQEGDRIGSLKAISTPGHTPGSMSFIDERTKAIIAGDAFQTRGGVSVSGHIQVLFPFPAMATWNKEEALKSAIKIKNQNPSLLAVGHGKMVMQPGSIIELAISKLEKTIS
ncbi:MBL fold metallo-hydrolase [Siminovitchia terrae]|uniref:MBL fold metallo-hydrolase n=1 Tax=Siminovitchia terrae TaxID=1914933 RepID=A0A429XCK9_SIMTE|nr:MBL fold metallo-hydrolase [Siminovitchia terrae]RST61205.1 MBL fold metallo-hydrolase [Siminovitchia terrae]